MYHFKFLTRKLHYWSRVGDLVRKLILTKKKLIRNSLTLSVSCSSSTLLQACSDIWRTCYGWPKYHTFFYNKWLPPWNTSRVLVCISSSTFIILSCVFVLMSHWCMLFNPYIIWIMFIWFRSSEVVNDSK